MGKLNQTDDYYTVKSRKNNPYKCMIKRNGGNHGGSYEFRTILTNRTHSKRFSRIDPISVGPRAHRRDCQSSSILA